MSSTAWGTGPRSNPTRSRAMRAWRNARCVRTCARPNGCAPGFPVTATSSEKSTSTACNRSEPVRHKGETMRLMSTHWAIALACLAASPAFASPTLDGIVGDHAVLQRGQPIVLAGAAEPSEEITISLAGATVTTTADRQGRFAARSEEHTSELQSLMRTSYAVFCLKKKKNINTPH